MLKRKKYISILVFILLVMLGLDLYLKPENIVYIKGEDSELKINLSLKEEMDRKNLPKNTILTRWVNDSITLGEICSAENLHVLLFRIPQGVCTSCIHRELYILKTHTGIKNFLPVNIITNIPVFRDFLLFSNYSRNEKLEFFNYSDKLTNLDNSGKPYYILLDQNLRIQEVFIVVKSDGELSQRFLDKICALE